MSLKSAIEDAIAWVRSTEPDPYIWVKKSELDALKGKVVDVKVLGQQIKGLAAQVEELRQSMNDEKDVHARAEAALQFKVALAEASRAAMAKDLANAQRERGIAVEDMMKINADNLDLRQQSAMFHQQYEDQTGLAGSPAVDVSAQALEAALRLAGITEIDMVDTAYRVPTGAALVKALAGLPDYGAYGVNRNDCDKYAAHIIERLRQALGNPSVGWQDFLFEGVHGRTRHRVNVVVGTDGDALRVGFFSYAPSAGAYLDSRYNCPSNRVFSTLPIGLDDKPWEFGRTEM